MARKTSIRLVLVVILLAIPLGSADALQTSPPEDSASYKISIPGVIEVGTSQGFINLQSTDVESIDIQVLRPEADRLSYGQIYPELNGAAAASISEIRPNALGKLIIMHLRKRPGFELLPGPNKVEILAAGQQVPRKTFLVHTPKGLCSNGREKILSLEKLTAALRNGSSSDRLVDWVLDCGVDFVSNAEAEAELRSANAEDRLILAIQNPSAPEFADRLRDALSVEGIVDLLRSGVPEEQLMEQVEDHGVSFQFTPEVRKKLEAANASRRLEENIAEMAGETMDRGLSESDIVLLLQDAHPDRIVRLVQERGISFRVDARTEDRLRNAGANQKVMQALSAASDKYERSH